MEEKLIKNYTEILENELVPAMGCTEPIAIAYAAASARKLLSEEVKHIDLFCSGNIIKNVKAVAGILGLVGGNPEKQLEVISVCATRTRRSCAL